MAMISTARRLGPAAVAATGVAYQCSCEHRLTAHNKELAEVLSLDHLLEPRSQREADADEAMRLRIDALYDGLDEYIERVPTVDRVAIEASGGHEAYGELTVRGGRSVTRTILPMQS